VAKVSVIIPARNERYMPQTVADIFAHATGDVEVIVILDGYWPDPLPPDDPRLILIHRTQPRGMRDGINSAAAIAKGKYLLKCDAHCLFSEGFDEALQAECADNWVVIPRRYSLDAENWKCAEKEPIDYEHLFYPYAHPEEPGLHGRPWLQRGRERRDILVDENLSFQGSCWFTTAEHFNKRIGGLSQVGYETFMGEPQEIGFKTQLGPWGGAVMSNKNAYYAHLHKGKSLWQAQGDLSGRIGGGERWRGNAYSFDFWWNNRWKERAHDLSWLIDRFMPIPGWPEDWKDYPNGRQA